MYYKDEVKQIKRDEERFEKDFDRRQWFDAARDAWTAYTLSSSAAKYGAEVETLADGSKVYAEQKPIEGLSKMWGDSGDWLKDLKSGSWGKGKELGEVASITPRSGDLNRRGVPYAGDPTSGVAKKTVKKYIQPLSSAAGNTAKTLARGTIAENSAKELARLSAEILGKDYTVNNLINSAENSFEVDPNAYNNMFGFFNTRK